MNVYEMEGFLRGKCLPGDIKVNESNAEYLVRKLTAVSELQSEVTALVSTLEKCREVSGCPAGVALQDHLRQLAAENVAIKSMNDCLSEELRGHESDGAFDGPMMHLIWWKTETPATDAVLTELRNEAGARAVELFAKTLGSPYSFRDEKYYEDGFTRAIEIVRDAQAPRFAKQLREGAK